MAREFGWTIDQIAELPQDKYDDFLTIISMVDAKKNQEKPTKKNIKSLKRH
ncbi:MAG: hypothetical protein V3U02_04495 [Calditrichia bacterium]